GEMQVWDGTGTGAIHFSAASVHADVLGHIVENRVVQVIPLAGGAAGQAAYGGVGAVGGDHQWGTELAAV
ncbi:hypothetical protein R0G64_32645, partial [Pseudomonas otitidis]|nr:hypothetical protein [Pseudomonas otitidis]